MIKVHTYDDHLEMTMNGEPADLCMDMEYIIKGFIDKFLKESQGFTDSEATDLLHHIIENAIDNKSKVVEKHAMKENEFVKKLGELIDEYKGKVN